MKRISVSISFIVIIIIFWQQPFHIPSQSKTPSYTVDESKYIIHIADPQQQNLKFHWKNEQGQIYGNIAALKNDLASKNRQLIFAMNGGMYLKDQAPQGLYIENNQLLSPLDTGSQKKGNFYLQPNGIFSILNDGTANVTATKDFLFNKAIKYATQSGPKLLIDGKYHPKINKGSPNLHIRNAVGILPDGKVMFAMSKEKVNFYDLATLFKQRQCKNALYLDGFVSRTYLPTAQSYQTDGKFGVIFTESH